MKQANLTLPEIAVLAGTRVALGAGIALLLSDSLSKNERRAVGWGLFTVGAVTTIPLARHVLGKLK